MCARYDAVPPGSEPRPSPTCSDQTNSSPNASRLSPDASRKQVKHFAARSVQHTSCAHRPRRMVSPKASRPPADQPGLPTNNQHTHRMVSQSVPSGTDLHPCARRKTSHRPWCRRSAQSVQLPHPDPVGRCRRWRPDRRQPSPVIPRTTSTHTAWCRRASRAA